VRLHGSPNSGIAIDKKCHRNDHLRQEFKEPVSSRRKVVLFDRLTEGLKYFRVTVSKKTVDAERAWIQAEYSGSTSEAIPDVVGPATRAAPKSTARRRASSHLPLSAPESLLEQEPPAG